MLWRIYHILSYTTWQLMASNWIYCHVIISQIISADTSYAANVLWDIADVGAWATVATKSISNISDLRKTYSTNSMKSSHSRIPMGTASENYHQSNRNDHAFGGERLSCMWKLFTLLSLIEEIQNPTSMWYTICVINPSFCITFPSPLSPRMLFFL